MSHKIIKTIIGFCLTMAMISCEIIPIDPTNPEEKPKPYNNVMLLYSAGFNNLASYLKGDIEELKTGFIPSAKDKNVVLVYSHFPTGSGYNNPSSPTLTRLTSNKNGVVQVDTLVVFPEGSISASSHQLKKVLTTVNETFPAKSYGMIFSSHATGYLPVGYYQNASSGSNIIEWSVRPEGECFVFPSSVPYIEPEYDPSLPMVKSIGQDQVGTYGNFISHEINLPDFAEAIPMQLDYILFDACLMGGIEVAYELKDKVNKIGFSQAEVLADGFCYGTLTTHLFGHKEPDLKSICDDYYQQYAERVGQHQSATISLIDCTQFDPLAKLCKNLFSKYSEKIMTMDPSRVQGYFRDGKHWFYDLESILRNADILPHELQQLYDALNVCVLYKAHTPMFLEIFKIDTFCGFSMYLPSQGSDRLNAFYKNLKWNQDTGLVN